MNFLAPLFLLGGLAVALPIVFHLIRRHTRERRVFSSLMFLVPTPPRMTRRNRFEHLVLLALRCAALVLLAAGFARPFFKDRTAEVPPAAPGRRIVVLVDTSASMRRSGLWDDARRQAEAIVRAATPADQVAVMKFDRRPTTLLAFSEWSAAAPAERANLAMARLGTVSPGWAGTNLDAALIGAAEAGAEDDGRPEAGRRQIVVISDLQEGSRVSALPAFEWPKNTEVTLRPVKSRTRTNAGLQWLAEAGAGDRAAAANVRLRVTNAADSQRERFQLSWTDAGGASATAPAIDVYVPPGQSRVVTMPVPAEVTGGGRIVLRGDDEDFDNTAFVIPPRPIRLPVLYRGADGADDVRQPQFFLRRALPDNPRLSVQVVSRPPATPVEPEVTRTAAVVFVTDPLPGDQAQALHEAMTAGKMVVFAPRNGDGAATLSRLLGGVRADLDDVRPANYAMFGEIDFRHPLFAPFADPRYSDFTKIHVWRYRRITWSGAPEARVVARFDDRAPALLDVVVGRGRLLVLATGWQPEDSQLALSSKFVPLLDAMIELSGAAPVRPAQYAVGDAALPAAVTDPGLHRLGNATEAPVVAVNLEVTESRTTMLALDDLERLGVPLRPANAAAAGGGEPRAVVPGTEAEIRQKLWRWLIVATLAVLLLETGLAGWTARRAAATPEGTPS